MKRKYFKTSVSTFKGYPVLNIHEVAEDGKALPHRAMPLISMGLEKAKAVIKHSEEIAKFVIENDK